MDLRPTAALMVLVLFLSGSLMAQQTRPADVKFTEAELTKFLDTQKDWLIKSAQLQQKQSNPKTEPVNVSVGNIGQLYQACLDLHHMTRDEFELIGQRAAEAFDAVMYLDGAYKTSLDQFDAEAAQENAAMSDAQKQLATYEEARKNGWRVLNAEDREEAFKSALADQQAAMEEVKERSEDASTVEAEAVQHDADAKVAEDQAKNPPADISADDRPEYILNKKNEAEAARQSAKEARVEEADSRKAEAEAQARADTAAERAAHPEIPVTDDEKGLAKSDNAAAILTAQKEISAARERLAKIAKERAELEKTAKAMTREVPPENIEIMRPHADEYQAQFEQAHPGATTRPK